MEMEMKQVTREQILAIMPDAAKRVDAYLFWFNRYAEQYNINTKIRWAHFLAQIAHESGELRYTHELGRSSYFLKYETGKLGKTLGNTQKGDGARYKGRGFIQLTGRSNYAQFQNHCQMAVLDHPEWVENPELCVRVSMWYWDQRGCNEAADSDDITKVTKKVNGGTNGLKRRQLYYNRARSALNID